MHQKYVLKAFLSKKVSSASSQIWFQFVLQVPIFGPLDCSSIPKPKLSTPPPLSLIPSAARSCPSTSDLHSHMAGVLNRWLWSKNDPPTSLIWPFDHLWHIWEKLRKWCSSGLLSGPYFIKVKIFLKSGFKKNWSSLSLGESLSFSSA